MHIRTHILTLAVTVTLFIFTLHSPLFPSARAAGASAWVTQAPDGTLAYKTTPAGDRIMDFSHAGYRGGGVPLPNVPVKITISPLADPKADATKLIQSAIDKLSALPLDADGHRGALLLAPGTYVCASPLNIDAGGVVLRGSGIDGPNASIIRMTGGKHVAILLGDRPDTTARSSVEARITDRYVPSGSLTFNVDSARGFAVGNFVEIRKTVTPAWIHFMGMDTLVRKDSDGKPQKQTWIKPGAKLTTLRTIAAINKNTITLDVPLSDSIDAKFQPAGGATLAKVPPPAWLSECGMENFVIQSPPQAMNHSQQLYAAFVMKAQDSWVRNVRMEETMDSTKINGRRITFDRVSVIRKVPHPGSSKPAEFMPNAGQILLNRCSVEGDNIWFAATLGGQAGPIVLLDCAFKGKGAVEGHMRWSTGMLLDNCVLTEGSIDFKNRGTMGGGHGWGLGWAVAWNCTARSYTVQQPPGAYNWAIGCNWLDKKSEQNPTKPVGTFDSLDKPVQPRSLYRAQLAARLGPAALAVLDAE